MFKITDRMIRLYLGLPIWSRLELFFGEQAVEYLGDPVMGWEYAPLQFSSQFDICVYLTSELGIRRFDSWPVDYPFRLPIVPSCYLKLILVLFPDVVFSSSEISDGVGLSIGLPGGDLTGWGCHSLEAALDLYVQCVDYYSRYCRPSFTELSGVDDLFTDRDGCDALNFRTHLDAARVFEKYWRFCSVVDSGFSVLSTPGCYWEAFCYQLKFIEGEIKIYCYYGRNDSILPFTNVAWNTPGGSSNFVGSLNVGTPFLKPALTKKSFPWNKK